jgi:hypothetical protein
MAEAERHRGRWGYQRLSDIVPRLSSQALLRDKVGPATAVRRRCSGAESVGMSMGVGGELFQSGREQCLFGEIECAVIRKIN